jgi:hypothetical protein
VPLLYALVEDGRTESGKHTRLETRTKESCMGASFFPCTEENAMKIHEFACRDPKDGELCLGRMKPGETLVEVRRDSDVQIDLVSWV